jgi:hypothetical protein
MTINGVEDESNLFQGGGQKFECRLLAAEAASTR